MQEENNKKPSFFAIIKDRLSAKTNSAFDDMDSRDKIKERYKQIRNKKIGIFVVAVIVVFIIIVIMRAMTLYSESQQEYAKKEERQTVDIKVDNFAIWQQQTEQQMKNMKETNSQKFQEISDAIEGLKQDGIKELGNILKKGLDNMNSRIKSLDERVENVDRYTQKKSKDLEEKVARQDSLFEKFKDEILSMLGKNTEETKKKFEELQAKQGELFDEANKKSDLALEEAKKKGETPPAETDGDKDKKDTTKKVTGNDVVGFPGEDTQDLEEVENDSPENKILVTKKLKLNITQKEPDPDDEYPDPNEPKELTFDIALGLSRAIMLNGVDASILGMGRQEDAPVMFSIMSKMSIANGEYTNTKDCLVLGSAVGQMTVQKAQIRLDKISCIFTNKEGDKFIAEGQVQGWASDENGQLGVQGVLITQEGKVLRASLPLEAVQTALDYVTRSATNVVLPTTGTPTGYQNLNASFGTGGSNAASQTLGRLIQIYEKYLQNLNPVINVRGGREVTLMFKGGEKIALVPYKGQGIAGIDSSDDEGMGDDKYNYQETNNAFMEDF